MLTQHKVTCQTGVDKASIADDTDQTHSDTGIYKHGFLSCIPHRPQYHDKKLYG